jgi:hypothetical protein
MKNLAEFKRKLTVGTELKMIYHCDFAGRDEKGKVVYKDSEPKSRKVKSVSSTQVCFETETGKDSWLSFPKASECTFTDNSISIYEDKEKVLTYIF